MYIFHKEDTATDPGIIKQPPSCLAGSGPLLFT